jgi:hypothetical protein
MCSPEIETAIANTTAAIAITIIKRRIVNWRRGESICEIVYFDAANGFAGKLTSRSSAWNQASFRRQRLRPGSGVSIGEPPDDDVVAACQIWFDFFVA